MLLFFVLFIFFMLHVQFLLQNIFWGKDEATFFNFKISYIFDKQTSQSALLFTLGCAACFTIGYKLFNRKIKRTTTGMMAVNSPTLPKNELALLNIMGLIAISYVLIVIAISNFNYTNMVAIREKSGFIFELRMIFLLLLSHVLLNRTWREIWNLREFKATRRILFLYFICVLLFQARSAVFELVAIFAYSYLVKTGDKIKIKYLIGLMAMMVVPNIIILGRLGVPDNTHDLITGLFSFEYSIILNNILSAAISAGAHTSHGISFLPSLELLIPSPIRDLFGMVVVKSGYYDDISGDAKSTGGGFSLLAEMYSNFGWFSLVVFGFLGTLIGRWNSRAARSGTVALQYSAAPLLYVAFILAFRNDFGVFLKYAIQLLIASWLLGICFPAKSYGIQTGESVATPRLI